MDVLLTSQKDLALKIDKLYQNFNKASKANKTLTYAENKQKEVNALWKTFTSQHEKLVNEYFDQLAGQPYLTETSYDDTEQRYQELIVKCAEHIEAESRRLDSLNVNNLDANNIGEITDDNLSDQAEKCKYQYDDLILLFNQLDEPNNDESIGFVEVQLKLMETSFAELKKIYRDLCLAKDNAVAMFNMQEVQLRYAKISGKLFDYIRISKQPNNLKQQLPAVKIPEFDGNATKWKHFIGLFKEIVHRNKNIDDGLKMHYLKTLVKGEAARIINHISPTGENYAVCYGLLKNRYENKRELVGKIFDKILDLPQGNYESSKHLKTIHDTVYEAIMEIKNIEIITDGIDILLVHILTKKLDQSTIKDYECRLSDVKEIQKLDEFLKYIECRFMALESAETRNGNANNNKQNNSVNNKSANDSKNFKKGFVSDYVVNCANCDEKHAIYQCPAYTKLSVSDRISTAKEKQLCLCCLKPNHKVKDCKSKFRVNSVKNVIIIHCCIWNQHIKRHCVLQLKINNITMRTRVKQVKKFKWQRIVLIMVPMFCWQLL